MHHHSMTTFYNDSRKISIEYSSFPVIHKVGNVGICVQLLMEINRQEPDQFSKQIYKLHSSINYNRND